MNVRHVTLAQVVNLDMSDRIVRCVMRNDFTVTGMAFPNSNNRGNTWHDCYTIVEFPDGYAIRNETFELTGTRYNVQRAMCREVQDVTNEILKG